MTRITPWLFHARAGLFLYAVLGCGCLSSGDRKDAPAMILSPSQVYPGNVLSLNMTVPGVDLSSCSVSPDSLVFEGPSGTSSVVVQDIDRLLLDSSTVRAYISVDVQAAAGSYKVAYRCDTATTFTGLLEVHALSSQLILSVNPHAAAAGTFGTTLLLSTGGDSPITDTENETELTGSTGFFTEKTQIVFSRENYVKITRQQQINPDEMELTVDIDPLTPVGEMSITAVSFGRTARGVLTITDRVAASVSVAPNRAERAALGDMSPNLTDLIISTQGLDFGTLDSDSGADDAYAVAVSFPENPGITVLDGAKVVEGSSGRVIKAQIHINSSAVLGQTQLHVAVGENQEAWTDFTVDLPKGQPLLQITSPKFVPKNGEATPVFVKAVNFSFKDMKDINCYPQVQCTVSDIVVNPETFVNMSMTVRVVPEMTDSNITIEVSIPDAVVQAYLPLKDAETVRLLWNQDSIHQGETSQARTLRRSDGGAFSTTTSVTVLPRSGLRIDSLSVDYTFTSLSVALSAAADAPTGPSYMVVNSGTNRWEVPFEIEAPQNVDSQQVVLSPGATLRKREVALIHVTVTNFDLPKDKSGFAFDDPGLQIIEMEAESDQRAVLNVDVSPRARNDMAVLYVEGEVGRAAATFKTLDFQQTEILKADPYSVTRAGGGNTTTIQVRKEGVLFDKPLVDVNDHIDLQVTRVSGGQSLVFDLGADDIGFGGWTGLIVENNSLKYLVPMYINASGNNFLTTQLPEFVSPGSERLDVTATLPSVMTPDESVLEVVSGHPDAYVAEAHVTPYSSHSVSFSLDVAHDALSDSTVDDPKRIPIFITTPDGAGLGEITIAEATSDSIDVGSDRTVELPSQTAELRFDVGNRVDDFPCFFQAETTDLPDHRAHISLVSKNNLDTAASTDTGLMWMISADTPRIGVSSTEPATALINVHTRKPAGTEPAESSTEGEEWNLSAETKVVDLCETPFLALGTIQRALDIDNVIFKKPSCALTAFVAARSLADRPWETPQLKLQYYGYSSEQWEQWKDRSENAGKPLQEYLDNPGANGSVTLISEDTGGLHSDPSIFLNPMLLGQATDVAVKIAPKLGSAGTYLIQIRRPYIIREFSRSEETPFIEIEVPENTLPSCELVQYNTDSDEETARLVFADAIETPVSESDPVSDTDSTTDTFSVGDISGDTDGEGDASEPIVTATRTVLIAGTPMTEADFVDIVAMLPPQGNFALMLYCEGELVDAVQIGPEEVFFGEGHSFIPTDDRPTFFRVANIDTNDNSRDFATTYFPTPGR